MIEYEGLPVRVEPMRVEDIGEVLEIERLSFSAPWSARAYEYELRYNDLAHYFVARLEARSLPPRNGWRRNLFAALFQPVPPPSPAIVAYIGFWLMAGEAHISTVAVRPEYRGRSWGELMLVAALDRALQLGAHEATLEVRVSNFPAQELYLKYGFEKVGMRKGYYSDNNEDAIIMTTPLLTSPEYQTRFQRLEKILIMRLSEPASARGPRRHAQARGDLTHGG